MCPDIVFKNVDLLLERGSKIAFVGQNGQGKSTLAKIIVGEIKFQGNLKILHGLYLIKRFIAKRTTC